ncbi:MAG: Bax inhibitor-1/YccA family protein [Candidatus Omnitrophica bacterium]|nr:Bax inhibitor-1/YccA family protein [Candidatus Omnitrophota bacterium]
MRSGNPVLSPKTFSIDRTAAGNTMTIQGTVNKTLLSLLIVVGAASLTWGRVIENSVGLIMLGGFGGFIVALVTVFKKEWAPVTTPIYCALEGLLLGGISFLYERQFPGIVINAVSLTFGTLFGLLMAYKSGMIQVTQNFRLGVVAATLGIGVLYLVNFVMMFFGANIGFVHESGWLGIGFSLFVVVIAALNLVLDFDFIEKGAQQGAPKYMEWYGAFGLMVTLIWLYLELLRLLAKLNRRR